MKESAEAKQLVEKGLKLFYEDNLDQASELFNKALEEHPKYARAICAIGMVWHRRGELDEALTHYRSAIDLDDKYARAFFNRGVVALEKDEFDKAIGDFDKALQICQEARFYYQRAIARYRKKDLDAAITDLSECINISSQQSVAVAYLWRGEIQFEKGLVSQALDDVDQAIQLRRDFVQVRWPRLDGRWIL